MERSVRDFRVVSIQFSSESTAQHELFIKENSAKMHSLEKPLGRTLFVLNIPPYATESSLKRVFSVAGPVEKVFLQFKPSDNSETEKQISTGFKVAYVVFKSSSGLANALKLRRLEPLSIKGKCILTGVRKWCEEYNKSIYNPDKLRDDVEKFMLKYDKEVKESKRKENKNQLVDEGWITVTKSARYSEIPKKEGRKKKKQLKNFYTFQIRESKMKHLAELRRKYEEDKKRINIMKQARKFKPF